MFEAIVYVLRTSIQWNALSRKLGASSTVYERFRLWAAGLQEFDEWKEWSGSGRVSMGSKSEPLSLARPPEPIGWIATNGEPSAAS
jgi:Putative transposase of IS4/5 family (DUF4096)